MIDTPFARAIPIEGDLYRIERPTLQRGLDLWYKPLTNYDDDRAEMSLAITAGPVRPRTLCSMGPVMCKQTLPNNNEKLLKVQRRFSAKQPRVMGYDDEQYVTVMDDSQATILRGEPREFMANEQRVNFWEDRPPSTGTILGHPLITFAIPDGVYRSWDMYPDAFKSFNHECTCRCS